MSAPIDALLASLNPAQREAALALDGPVLVVAGPGTGKTHTLGARLAYLVLAKSQPAASLLAVTFTARAAREMKERLRRRIGNAADEAAIDTLHGFCLKLLRAHAADVGLPPDFAVCDARAQAVQLQRCLRRLNREDSPSAVQRTLQELSRARNRSDAPEAAIADSGLSEVYEAYRARLRRQALVDFDDLISLGVRLLAETPEAVERLRARYHYISVDEFQDVNPLQYRLLRLLGGERPNLWAVGDADQAIYAFRGAQVENFLRFEHDFPGSRLIRPECNYRSTPQIVRVAAQVIAHNTRRLPHTPSARRDDGPIIRVVSLPDETAEAAWLVREVEERVGGTSYYQHYRGSVADSVSQRRGSFRDVAVLVRVKALARPIEEAFARAGIPCRVVGGTRFFDRKAVKDTLAHLLALRQPETDDALARILNTPPRGIGRETQAALEADAEQREQPLAALLEERAAGNRRIAEFLRMLGTLRTEMAQTSLSRFLAALLDTTGLKRWHVEQDPRRENDFLRLAAHAAQYDDLSAPAAADRLLEEAALAADADDYDPDADAVTVMTLHAAKGLEFDEVFLCGVEEDVIPAAGADIEEERRLFYVGLTRARERAHLLFCRRRLLYGERRERSASRFISEFEASLRETTVVADRARAPQDPQEDQQLSLL